MTNSCPNDKDGNPTGGAQTTSTAPTATVLEAENPVDETKDPDSASTLEDPPPEDKDGDFDDCVLTEHGVETGVVVVSRPSNPIAGQTAGTISQNIGTHDQPYAKGTPELLYKGHAGKTPADSKENAEADEKPTLTPLVVPSNLPVPRKIEMVALVDLEPDPVNSTVYTPSTALAEQALIGSMKEHGILTPLLGRRLTDGKVRIQSGHRRAKAAEAAGLTHVPMELVETLPGDKGQAILIHANIQRDKTNEEKIREFLALRKGASERAKARQQAGGRK